MSTNGISSQAPSYQPNSQQSAFQQNFQTLTQAIQSGNLAAAQQAYASLTQNAPAQSTGGSTGSLANSFQQALSSIGAALQSGNISAAQTAVQTMQQSMMAHHGHHHDGAPSQSSEANSSPQTSTNIATLPSSASSLIDISA